MSDINVVPYIDVMLVLLVIFMVTAPLLTQGVDVDLPQVDSEVVTSDDGQLLVISVKADGSYYLNLNADPGQRLDLNGVLSRALAARQRHPRIPVHVGGDRNVAFGRVIELIAALKQAGVTKIGFLTEPVEG